MAFGKIELTRKRFVSLFSVNQTGCYEDICTCGLHRARAGQSTFRSDGVCGTPMTLLVPTCAL